MRKRHFLVIIFLVLGLIGIEIYQYSKTFKEELVAAVTVGVPNPGHAWSTMECSSSTLCIDTVNGRLGIGATTPSALLTLSNASLPQIDFLTGSTKRADIRASSGTLYLNSITGNDIQLQTNSDTKVIVTSAGNVGIGTVNPAEKLEVNGKIKAKQFGTDSGLVSMDIGTITMDYTLGDRQGAYLVQLAVWGGMNELSRTYLVMPGPSNQVPSITLLGTYSMSGGYGDVSVTAPAAQTIRLTWTRSTYSGSRQWSITNFY